MLGLAQTQTFAPATLPPHAANQSLAKQNRKPSQLIENTHQYQKSIANFCPLFRAHSPRRNSPRASCYLELLSGRCIPALACASIRLSAGSCAQPPGGGAVMMFASHHISNRTSVLSPYEMPIPAHPRPKSRAPSAFPFCNFAFPFSVFNPSEVKHENLQH
jgi:hypothetical protein